MSQSPTSGLSSPRVPQGVKRFLINLLPLIFSVSCIIPLVWLLYSTMKTNSQFEADVMGLPKSFYLDNYAYVLNTTPIGHYLFNTLRNTAIALFFVLLLGFINGYFISRFRFRGRKLLYSLYISALFIPIHALLLPTYLMFSSAHMTDQWYSTILPMISLELTTTVFLVSSYLTTVPKELEEAAAIDGSTFSQTLFRIILPVCVPVLVTAGIISFFHCWNEFSYSLVLLSKEKYYTISLALTRFKGENRIDYPRMMTAMVIAMTPALLMYVFFSKYIIRGMVAGALKG